MTGYLPVAYAFLDRESRTELVNTCRKNGRNSTNSEYPLDLVPVPAKPKVYEAWMNVYENGGTDLCQSIASANELIKTTIPKRIACVHLTGTAET